MFLLNRQFLPRVGHDTRELFVVVRLVEVHQRHKVIQISLVLDVENLILVVLHLIGISELGEFLEKILTLLLLDLELAILNIEVENSPDIFWLELWNKLIHTISSDVWYIAVFTSEEREHLGYLCLDLCNLLSKLLVTCNGERLDNDVENPFSFFFDLVLLGIESVSNFDLELLRNIFLSNILVLSRAEVVIDVLRHKLVLESLVSILVWCRRLTSLLEDLLLDGSLLIQFLLLDGRAVDLLVIRIVDGRPNFFEFSWPTLVFVDELQIFLIKLLLGVRFLLLASLLLLKLLAHPSPLLLLLPGDLVVVGDKIILKSVKIESKTYIVASSLVIVFIVRILHLDRLKE